MRPRNMWAIHGSIFSSLGWEVVQSVVHQPLEQAGTKSKPFGPLHFQSLLLS